MIIFSQQHPAVSSGSVHPFSNRSKVVDIGQGLQIKIEPKTQRPQLLKNGKPVLIIATRTEYNLIKKTLDEALKNNPHSEILQKAYQSIHFDNQNGLLAKSVRQSGSQIFVFNEKFPVPVGIPLNINSIREDIRWGRELGLSKTAEVSRPMLETAPPVFINHKGQFYFKDQPNQFLSLHQLITHPQLERQFTPALKQDLLEKLENFQARGIFLLPEIDKKNPRVTLDKLKAIYSFFVSFGQSRDIPERSFDPSRVNPYSWKDPQYAMAQGSKDSLRNLRNVIYKEIGGLVQIKQNTLYVFGTKLDVRGLAVKEAKTDLEKIFSKMVIHNESFSVGMQKAGQEIGILEPEAVIKVVYGSRFSKSYDSDQLSRFYGQYRPDQRKAVHLQYLGSQLGGGESGLLEKKYAVNGNLLRKVMSGSKQTDSQYQSAQKILEKKITSLPQANQKTILMLRLMMTEENPLKRVILLTGLLMITDKNFSKHPDFKKITSLLSSQEKYELGAVVYLISDSRELYDATKQLTTSGRSNTPIDRALSGVEKKYGFDEGDALGSKLKLVYKKDESLDAVHVLHNSDSELIYSSVVTIEYQSRIADHFFKITGNDFFSEGKSSAHNLFPKVPKEKMAAVHEKYQTLMNSKKTQIEKNLKTDREQAQNLEREYQELIGEYAQSQMEVAYRFYQENLLSDLDFDRAEANKIIKEKGSNFQGFKNWLQGLEQKESCARRLAYIYNHPETTIDEKVKLIDRLGLMGEKAEAFILYANSETLRLQRDLTGENLTFGDHSEKLIKKLGREAIVIAASLAVDALSMGTLTPAIALRIANLGRLVKMGMIPKESAKKIVTALIANAKKIVKIDRKLASVPSFEAINHVVPGKSSLP